MVAIHDNGFVPEGMAGEGWTASRDPALYPLAELMVLARTAARSKADGLPALRAASRHRAGAMRYWAATGLLILGAAATPARADLRALLADPEPQVRIVAAEALAGLGEADRAVPVLVALATPPQPWQVRLYALNALTFIGPAAMPALSIAQAAKDDSSEYIKNAGRYLALKLTGTYTPQTQVFDYEGFMKKVRAGQGPG